MNKKLKFLSNYDDKIGEVTMNLSELISCAEKVSELYQKMSDESVGYSQQQGISCVKGCGKCCNNPEVFVTSLEMLPLALQLYFRHEKEPEKLLDIMEKLQKQNVCTFYQPTSPDKSSGYCGVYQNRGVICRLFGWTQVTTRRGRELSVCHLIDHGPLPVETAPDIVRWQQEIQNVNYELSKDLVPINQAFIQALEKVLLSAQYL